MYWRHAYLREKAAAVRGSTFKIDLPESGNLGSLFLRLEGRNQTSTPMGALAKWRLIDYISKVEVIANGSMPLVSATGKQLQYAAFLDQKVSSPSKWVEYSQAYNRDYILINFGRLFKDKLMGLNLAAFDSVELQITNDMTSTLYQDETYWTIMMNFLEDAGPRPFMGYLKKEEWRTWQSVSDEKKYFVLPTADVMRRIILQSIPDLDSDEVEESNPFNCMDSIQLYLKGGLLTVWDAGLDDLMYLNKLENKAYVLTGGWLYHDAGKGAYTGVGYVDKLALAGGVKTSVAATVIPTIDGNSQSGTIEPQALTPDHTIGFMAEGIGYHNCAVFDFENGERPAEWLDPEVQKEILLNIHTRSGATYADGTLAVILERFVPST